MEMRVNQVERMIRMMITRMMMIRMMNGHHPRFLFPMPIATPFHGMIVVLHLSHSSSIF